MVKEASANELLMRHRNGSTDGIKTGAPPLSGRSMAVTYLLVMWCPVYKQRDFHLGFDTELENLIGGGKGKGTSGSPASFGPGVEPPPCPPGGSWLVPGPFFWMRLP